MIDNTNLQRNIEYVRDLLSPYLDGEVTDEERKLVEQALAISPELREDLETLRQTVSLVASLSRVATPRPFTLSEADALSAAPAPKKYFGLPAWASGLAALAAVLVCILAAGGIFLRGQFSGAPAGEIAHLAAEQPAAEEAAPPAETEIAVEKEAELEAPQEEAAAAAPTEMPAPAEIPAPEKEAQEPTNEVEMAEAEKSVADEAAETTAPTEEGAAPPGEADTNRGAEGGTYVDTGVAPTSTPAPLPTPSPTVLAMPATEIAEEQAITGVENATEPPGEAEAPPPLTSEVQPEQKEWAPRPVEIKNQKLSVTPGLIQIEGMIEAAPGSTLIATLQRNGEPFNSWADPASLQTTVQADGRFSFNIQSHAIQRNRDLFALEPANYQIIITSVGTDTPVIASVFFDTSGPPMVTPLPTATPLPPSPTASPSSTVIARLTFVPTVTPTIGGTNVSPGLVEGPPPKRPLWPVGVGIIALVGGLVIVGLIVWLVIRRRQ